MIQTATRRFTDAEREEIERQLLDMVTETRSFADDLSWRGVAGVICGIVAIIMVVSLFGIPDAWGIGVIVVATVAGFIVDWRVRSQTNDLLHYNRRRYAARLAKRLVRGEIEEMTVTASGVVRVIDNYDGISTCFFDVGNNKVLYLREEALWDAAENAGLDKRDAGMFLPSAFRLTRYPDATDEVIHLEPLGPQLTPLRTLAVSGLEEEYHELTNLDVLENVSLATLESDLPFSLSVESGA
ncbi:MAG: hypothetical protein H7145_08620 [Akkermansiaceae bacterium]|nr:hypothetical protein [Armatimonadota bacterium]